MMIILFIFEINFGPSGRKIENMTILPNLLVLILNYLVLAQRRPCMLEDYIERSFYNNGAVNLGLHQLDLIIGIV